MHAAFQFLIQRFHHRTVLGKTALSSQAGRGNTNTKMRFAGGVPSGVTPVLVTFVNHFKVAWREFDRKFFDNDVANRHMDTV